MWPFQRKSDATKSTFPDGWTDELSIQLSGNHTVDELVDFIIQAVVRNDLNNIQERVASSFHISLEDAELARERTFGGVFRALTQNPVNCPDSRLDPVAWTSYQRVIQEPALIQAFYPEDKSD